MTYKFIFLTLLQIARDLVNNRDQEFINYQAIDRYGVPQVTILIAHGREAWRVSDFAANVYRREKL